VSARVLSLEEGISESVRILRDGGIVGLPTETVYGLAADAFQALAVARIFEAKGRPLSDPLIVHLPEAGWLDRVVGSLSPALTELVHKLASDFWPGPLTLLLPKHPDLPDLVTAGSDLVAVRVSSHPLFQEVQLRLGSPIAAPSANRFGSISPTTAQDVRIELGDRIDLILDGGPCKHGMESTIVALQENCLKVLRPGPITNDQLKKYGHVVSFGHALASPGSLPGHYAPKKELQIINTDIKERFFDPLGGYLAFSAPPKNIADGFASIEVLSRNGDLCEAAANFYTALRRLDQSKAVILYAEPVPEEGIGVAIMDRLRRAEYGSLFGTGHHQPLASKK